MSMDLVNGPESSMSWKGNIGPSMDKDNWRSGPGPGVGGPGGKYNQ